MSTLRTIIAVSLMALTAILGVVAITGLIIYRSLVVEVAEDMEKLETLEGVEDFETTRIYDRNGTLLYEVFNEGRRTESTARAQDCKAHS